MINITDNDFTEIIFNDVTNLWSLWLNGKIVKTAKNKETLIKILRG